MTKFRIKGTTIGYDIPVVIISFVALIVALSIYKPKPQKKPLTTQLTKQKK